MPAPYYVMTIAVQVGERTYASTLRLPSNVKTWAEKQRDAQRCARLTESLYWEAAGAIVDDIAADPAVAAQYAQQPPPAAETFGHTKTLAAEDVANSGDLPF